MFKYTSHKLTFSPCPFKHVLCKPDLNLKMMQYKQLYVVQSVMSVLQMKLTTDRTP